LSQRLFFVTDLHLRIAEAAGFVLPFDIPDADVCVVAGDITDRMLTGMEWLARTIGRRMPVVMTLGNHDLYGQDMPVARRKAPARAADLGLTLLDDGEAVVGGTRFVGGTLWTDFRLFESLGGPVAHSRSACMASVRNSLADYDEIHATEVSGGVMARTLTPADTARYHAATVSFIEKTLATPFDGPTVVVTHHAPSFGSVHTRFMDRASSAAYASDLDWMMEKYSPEYWLHGHVHDSFDYTVGGTRVVCNPRGYATFPNPGFDPRMIIDVTRSSVPGAGATMPETGMPG